MEFGSSLTRQSQSHDIYNVKLKLLFILIHSLLGRNSLVSFSC